LRRLRENTIDIYQTHSRDLAAKTIQSIAIESCLAPGVIPTAFEQEWHARNLDVMLEQDTFKLDAIQATQQSTPDSRRAALDRVA
jgi:cyclase